MLFLIFFQVFSLLHMTIVAMKTSRPSSSLSEFPVGDQSKVSHFLRITSQLPSSTDPVITGNYLIIPAIMQEKIKAIYDECKSKNVSQDRLVAVQETIIETITNWKDIHDMSIFEESFRLLDEILNSPNEPASSSLTEKFDFTSFEEKMKTPSAIDFHKKLSDIVFQKLPQACQLKSFILKICIDKIIDNEVKNLWEDTLIDAIKNYVHNHKSDNSKEDNLFLLHLTHLFNLMASFFEERYAQIKSKEGTTSMDQSEVAIIEKNIVQTYGTDWSALNSSFPDFTDPVIFEMQRIFENEVKKQIKDLYECLSNSNIAENEIKVIQENLLNEISGYVNGSKLDQLTNYLQTCKNNCEQIGLKFKKPKLESFGIEDMLQDTSQVISPELFSPIFQQGDKIFTFPTPSPLEVTSSPAKENISEDTDVKISLEDQIKNIDQLYPSYSRNPSFASSEVENIAVQIKSEEPSSSKTEEHDSEFSAKETETVGSHQTQEILSEPADPHAEEVQPASKAGSPETHKNAEE